MFSISYAEPYKAIRRFSASLNHQKIAEWLLLDLQQINEAIVMVASSVALSDLEMRVKFANLFGHVFHFLVEAIGWYGAVSRGTSLLTLHELMSEEHIRKVDSATAVKFVKSLNRNYYYKLKSIVNAILQLKSEVADGSSLGSISEVRDIYMTVQATDDDIQAISQVLLVHQIGPEGQARQIAE
ncbi:hypothetical protein ABVK25_001792 [Lepraria finkii]|uniref:Uncharacterized protein n=1 Tax=Lepraria finkii TaxID=1340010 RepID=A0ABR4BN36_9LECA